MSDEQKPETPPEAANTAAAAEESCSDAAEDAECDVSSAARKIKEGAAELHSAVMDQGQEKFEDLCKAADETIRANPYRSVLAAFGMGALVGIVLFRR